jgi:hypothetical protein
MGPKDPKTPDQDTYTEPSCTLPGTTLTQQRLPSKPEGRDIPKPQNHKISSLPFLLLIVLYNLGTIKNLKATQMFQSFTCYLSNSFHQLPPPSPPRYQSNLHIYSPSLPYPNPNQNPYPNPTFSGSPGNSYQTRILWGVQFQLGICRLGLGPPTPCLVRNQLPAVLMTSQGLATYGVNFVFQ